MQVYHNIQQLELEVYIVRGEVFRQVMALLQHWVLGSRPLVTFVTVSRTVSHVSAENQGTFSDYHFDERNYHYQTGGYWETVATRCGLWLEIHSLNYSSADAKNGFSSRLSKN